MCFFQELLVKIDKRSDQNNDGMVVLVILDHELSFARSVLEHGTENPYSHVLQEKLLKRVTVLL